jgi:type VI secretion system secreted protein VgrG
VSQVSQQYRQARIDSPLGEDYLLLHNLHGSERLSGGFEYQLSVQSADLAIKPDELLGNEIAVTYFSEDGQSRVFHGRVSRFENRGTIEGAEQTAMYQLTMVPWMWFLKHNQDYRIFQRLTVPDIVKRVFRQQGFRDFKIKLHEQYEDREYCVQYNESDFDFVSRLLEEEGIYYYYVHEDDGHTLVLCDSTTGYFGLDEEVNLLPVGQEQHAKIKSWRRVCEFRTSAVAQRDFNFRRPNDSLNTTASTEVRVDGNASLEYFEYPGNYRHEDHGQRLTRVRAEELKSGQDCRNGNSYCLSFTPGGKFVVAGDAGSVDANHSFVLTEVHTELNSNLSSSKDSIDFQNQFNCIPAQSLFRPQRKTRKPVVEGPQTAIVVTDGQEIVVDEFARVKVQFHWDRVGQRNINSSCWIRVSQGHAGQNWGRIDIPRKHEEVIVNFLNGDPDRPIITGRVYNGNNFPPYDLDGAGDNLKNKTRRGITTNTYEGPGFNELSMDDALGKEQVRIHAQKNMDTFVRGDDKTRVLGSQHLLIGGEGSQGKFSSNEPSGDQTEAVHRDKTQSVGRHQAEHIKGDKYLFVGFGGNGGFRQVLVEKQEYKLVGKDGSHLKIEGVYNQRIDSDLSIEVGGDYMHRVAGDIGLAAGQGKEIHLNAGGQVVVQSRSICFRTGGGFITLDDSGVSIVGRQIKINSGGGSLGGRSCNPQAPSGQRKYQLAQPASADCYRDDRRRGGENSTNDNSTGEPMAADDETPATQHEVFSDHQDVFTDADNVFVDPTRTEPSPPPVISDDYTIHSNPIDENEVKPENQPSDRSTLPMISDDYTIHSNPIDDDEVKPENENDPLDHSTDD